jgi:hypothetical protein
MLSRSARELTLFAEFYHFTGGDPDQILLT